MGRKARAKGKEWENRVCQEAREATGAAAAEVHRNDAESRAGEAGVGDLVTPWPLCLQVRARDTANGWSALQDAEAAAGGEEGVLPVGMAVRTRGGGRPAWTLAVMRLPTWNELLRRAMPNMTEDQRLTDVWRFDRAVGVFRAYEEMRERRGLKRGEELEDALLVRKRGSDEWALALEQGRFWRLVAAAWPRDDSEEVDG